MIGLADPRTVSDRTAARPLPRNVLVRERLGSRMDEILDTAVLLVCGPGGYGKSLLVASWANSRPALRTAWVRASAFAGRATDMWLTIIAAIDAEWPALLPDVNDLRARSRSAPGELPGELARRIREGPDDVVLVVDDLHAVVAPDQHEQLLEFVAAGHDRLHLILITRHDPPWPLHRLRLDGLLAEIRTDDLAFRADEASRLFELLDLALSPSQADRLVIRTEGWAAALRLAALGMAQASDPVEYLDSLSGRSGYIADYLMREVFQGQTADWRLFLTRISIVDDVCAELAVALGAGDDSADRLAALADRNVFVHQLGDRPGWYRLHPLVLDFLRSQAVTGRQQVELHRLAARWYVGQGEPFAGLRHALLGHQWAMAGDLVGTHLVSWAVCRHPAALADLLAPIPVEVVLSQPGLALGVAATRVMVGRADGLEQALDAAVAGLRTVTGRRRRRYEVLLDCISFGVHRMRGDLAGLLATCLRMPLDPVVLADLGLADWATLRILTLSNRGTVEMWTGDLTRARERLQTTADEPLGAALVLPILNSRAHLAYLQWALGELNSAEHSARAAIDALSSAVAAVPQAVCGYLALAETAIDRYELGDAERWLALADKAAGEPHTRLAAGLARARMYRAGGHQLKAVEAIRAAEEAFGDLPVPPLLVGYLDDARAIGQPGAPGSTMATGLDPVAAEANGAGTLRTQVTLAAAAALAAAKDTSGALKQLAPGLGAAAPQRFRLPFVSAGEPMRNLLEQAVSAGTAESVFAVDLLNRMASPSARAGFRSSLPLTERERNVLRYLATALTAKEIAQNLYVSVNTVKTHMRSIYQKLGVDGRRDAVRYAQEFALL